MKIAILNGRIIDPANQRDTQASLYIEEGCIKAIQDAPFAFIPDLTLDASGCWVIPGIIAMGCHAFTLNDKQAALKGGITSVCVNPLAPFLYTQGPAEPQLYPIAPLLITDQNGQWMNDYVALKNSGYIALSQGTQPQSDWLAIKHCYDMAQSAGLPVIITPQEPTLSRGVAHEGVVATRLGLPMISEIAETFALVQHLILIEKTGVQAHFSGLSCHQSLPYIQAAKEKGLPVTADVPMHALHLTENDIADFNPHCHVHPPLRHERDRSALLKGLQEGIIDGISADHRPLPKHAKCAPFAESIPGMSTLDTLLSLGVRLVHTHQLTPSQLIRALTYRLAEIFNLPKGQLTVGQKADLVILDPHAHWPVTEESLQSQGKNTPFLGWELPGVVRQTLCGNQEKR